jgi:hypothetical protein
VILSSALSVSSIAPFWLVSPRKSGLKPRYGTVPQRHGTAQKKHHNCENLASESHPGVAPLPEDPLLEIREALGRRVDYYLTPSRRKEGNRRRPTATSPRFASQCLPCPAAGDLPGARSDCGVLSGLTIALAITSRVPAINPRLTGHRAPGARMLCGTASRLE